MAAKLLAAVEKNEAGEARKIINGADIRRLPYSQGKMGDYLERITLNLQRGTNQNITDVQWTAVHFLIVNGNISEEDKLHAIKILIANSGFHMRQAISMKSTYIDDSDLSGFMTLLLCASTYNLVLLKYFLSEEFASMWNIKEMEKLLLAAFDSGSSVWLPVMISSPAFVHYFESLSCDKKKETYNQMLAMSNGLEEFTGTLLCEQPYVPLYLLHLVQLFRKKRLSGYFDSFAKASSNIGLWQLEQLS